MADYRLYYWPVPFRGQFVRAVLAHAGKSWTEADADDIAALMGGEVAEMPVPFMGPPVLVDSDAKVAIAQMPAILLYLGETLGLLPASPALRAMSIKVVNDANDVLDDVTLDGGREMWTAESWRDFVPRLQKWMSIFEETGRRHGLQADAGFMLGGDAPGIADLATATLWATMTNRLPPLAAMLAGSAPLIAGLTKRVAGLPEQAALAARAERDYGDAYCGGQIEGSLRKSLG